MEGGEASNLYDTLGNNSNSSLETNPSLTLTNNYLWGQSAEANSSSQPWICTSTNYPPLVFRPNIPIASEASCSNIGGVFQPTFPQRKRSSITRLLHHDQVEVDLNDKTPISSPHALGLTLNADSNMDNQTKKGTQSMKSQWTKEEDRKLVDLVTQYGCKKWATIAEHMEGRVGKQCRERWHNHLRPDIKKSLIWTEEEETLMIEAHQRVGNKWAEIAKHVPGRAENAVKNHWNATMRRQTSKRKIKKPAEKLNGVILSTVLEDYIKAKYFNKESESTASDLDHHLAENSPTNCDECDAGDDDDDDADSIEYLLLEVLDEEMQFIETLFKDREKCKNEATSSSATNVLENENSNSASSTSAMENAADDYLAYPSESNDEQVDVDL